MRYVIAMAIWHRLELTKKVLRHHLRYGRKVVLGVSPEDAEIMGWLDTMGIEYIVVENTSLKRKYNRILKYIGEHYYDLPVMILGSDDIFDERYENLAFDYLPRNLIVQPDYLYFYDQSRDEVIYFKGNIDAGRIIDPILLRRLDYTIFLEDNQFKGLGNSFDKRLRSENMTVVKEKVSGEYYFVDIKNECSLNPFERFYPISTKGEFGDVKRFISGELN